MTLRALIIALVLLSLTAPRGMAGEASVSGNDSVSKREMERMHKFFPTTQRDSMYDAAAKYKAHNLANGNMHNFYKGWMNEIIYDINFNHFYKAMKKTIEMGKDMKWRNCTTELHNASYMMGIIYSLQGNNAMAELSLKQALNETPADDTVGKIQVYKELANIKLEHHPEQAMKDIDMAMSLAGAEKMKYEQSAITGFKIITAFFLNDYETVKRCFHDYQQMKETYGKDFCHTYDTYVLMAWHTACGEYGKAIEQAGLMTNIDEFKMKAKIYEAAGDTAAAYKAQLDYIRTKDSVNGQTMVQDINELTGDIELTKMADKARRNKLMNIVLLLVIASAAVVIIALALIIRNRNGFLKKLRRKNNELEAMRDKALEAERMKMSIQRNMSHEIRTPLNIISGFAQIMSMPDFQMSHRERSDMAERIMENSNQIVRLINNLLYVSMESSTSYMEKNDVMACNDICRKAAATFRQNNPGTAEISFSTTADDRLTIKTNADGIYKILECLLDNARKFTADGIITMECSYSKKENTVSFSIANTGESIPAEKAKEVFDPFFKINNDKEGLGLGLPLSQQIAGQLGGEISIDTSYTAGTRIVVTLPLGED